MDKPQVIKVRPDHIDEDMQSPVISGLLERGYVIASVIILEDPRRPEGDRVRLGLIMVPPPEASVDVVATVPWTLTALLGVMAVCIVVVTAMLAALLVG